MQSIAIVGAGLIGRSWIRVFARSGFAARVFDPDPKQTDRAVAWARRSAEEDERPGLLAPREARAQEGPILACKTREEVLSAWRDRMVKRILRLKAEDPPPGAGSEAASRAVPKPDSPGQKAPRQ